MTTVLSDIRAGDMVVNRGARPPALYPDPAKRERDLACVGELLHVHVWPDNVGINVAPHGDILSLGIWRWDDRLPGFVVVRPGPLFAWRTRRAIARMDAQVRELKARHAAIAEVFVELAEPRVEVRR